MSLTLFYASGACSLAPHIALNEIGAAFDAARVNLAEGEQLKPEYLAVNPKGRVPTLVVDGVALTENPAILHYLAARFPEAGLAPLGDPFALAQVLSFNVFIASTVHVAFAHIFRPSRYGDGDAAALAMKAKAPESLAQAFALIEARLENGPWAHGESYSISDPYLYVMARWLWRGKFVDLEALPRVRGHMDRMQARPAVATTLESEGLPAL